MIKQVDAYTNLGKAFLDNGNITKAECILNQGLDIDCFHIPTIRNLFDVYMLKNDLPKAEKFVRTIARTTKLTRSTECAWFNI